MVFLLNLLELFIKYQILFFYFYFLGRSIVFLFSHYYLKEENIPDTIFFVNSKIVYPIIGIVFLGNFLLIANFFLPLKNIFVLIFMILLIIPNIFFTNLNVSNLIKFENIFNYLIIPLVLIISSFDILFHYDAGYYHLNNQNWIYESNIVLGFVNIFWAFGMSSIYEYISAFFWFDQSYIFLHLINLFFVHFFYTYCVETIFNGKEKLLKNASLFLLIFSILDNFGLGGGRNGFIYIESMGKQDNAIGILFFFLSITIFIYIKNKEINTFDFVFLPLICLFALEIKISSAIVVFLYLYLLFLLIKNKKYKTKDIFLVHVPTLFFSFFWLLKNLLTSGCLVFPISITCINNFSWFVKGSTTAYQTITVNSSYSIFRFNSIVEMINAYRFEIGDIKNIYTNFLVSFLILLILRKVFYTKVEDQLNIKYILISYSLLNIVYLVLYGPIPRYSIGFQLTLIGMIGLISNELKINIKKPFVYLLIFSSVVLIVRLDSYFYAFSNQEPKYKSFNPREAVNYTAFNEYWSIPSNGDQCWVNIRCSMAESDITIKNENFFKAAYKK